LTCAWVKAEVAIARGDTLTDVTLAEACTPLLAAAVAVTTAVPALFGAVNKPSEEIDPALADQTTAVWGVFVTVAVNCTFPPLET
jgi:hypothetical protein